MKKLSKVMIFALAAILAIPHIYTGSNTVLASGKYKVVLDGVELKTTNSLQNVNDSILAPFREIGDAMGAEIDWDPSDQKITAYRGNRYSIMIIGDTIITYGEYSLDSVGKIKYETQKSEFMRVAPALMNGFTYIPVRYIAETLGATVDWEANTGTAVITSERITSSTPTPDTNSSSTTKPDNFGDFSNTAYFRPINSRTAQEMYNDSKNKPFIFVIYDSSKDSSKMIVPSIQDLALDVKVRIYGVDMNDSDNKKSDNEWLWDGFFREKDFKDPTVYFVHSKSKVTQIQEPSKMDDLKKEITNFSTLADTEYEYGDFKDTTYFKTKADTYIRNEYLSEREFVVVLYDSTDANSKQYIPVIKSAAKEKGIVVYGLNIDSYPSFYNRIDFMKDYSYTATEALPAIFSVYKDKDDITVNKRPTTVSKVLSILDEFEAKSGTTSSKRRFDTVSSTGNYKNTRMIDLKDKYDDKDSSFMLLLYNSEDGNSTLSNINDIVSEMNYYSSTKSYFYGINEADESSSNFKKNNSWIYDRISTNDKTPILICYIDGKYHSMLKNATNYADYSKFIDNHRH